MIPLGLLPTWYSAPVAHKSLLQNKADSVTKPGLEEGSTQDSSWHKLAFPQDPYKFTSHEGNSLQGPERSHLPVRYHSSILDGHSRVTRYGGKGPQEFWLQPDQWPLDQFVVLNAQSPITRISLEEEAKKMQSPMAPSRGRTSSDSEGVW